MPFWRLVDIASLKQQGGAVGPNSVRAVGEQSEGRNRRERLSETPPT